MGDVSIESNLFAELPSQLPDEFFTTLLRADDLRIERIVSYGNVSPKDFWYDQPQHEWVIVLKGVARLQFEDCMVEMKPGDFVNIPARKKHRVEWTTPDEPTVWLGVRYNAVSKLCDGEAHRRLEGVQVMSGTFSEITIALFDHPVDPFHFLRLQ